MAVAPGMTLAKAREHSGIYSPYFLESDADDDDDGGGAASEDTAHSVKDRARERVTDIMLQVEQAKESERMKKKRKMQLAKTKQYQQAWKKQPSHIRHLGWDASDTDDEEELTDAQIDHELAMYLNDVADDKVLDQQIDDLVSHKKYDTLRGIAKILKVTLTKKDTCKRIGEKLKQLHRLNRTVSRIEGVENLINATTSANGRVLLGQLTIFALQILAQVQLGDTYNPTDDKNKLIDQLMSTFRSVDKINEAIDTLKIVAKGKGIRIYETMHAASTKESTVFPFNPDEDDLLPRFSKTLRL